MIVWGFNESYCILERTQSISLATSLRAAAVWTCLKRNIERWNINPLCFKLSHRLWEVPFSVRDQRVAKLPAWISFPRLQHVFVSLEGKNIEDGWVLSPAHPQHARTNSFPCLQTWLFNLCSSSISCLQRLTHWYKEELLLQPRLPPEWGWLLRSRSHLLACTVYFE